MSDIDLPRLVEAARTLSRAFVTGTTSRYGMSVPPDQYHDGDLVCGEIARQLERLAQYDPSTKGKGGLFTLDADCYAHNLQADQDRITQLSRENAQLTAEIERLNAALDRALPATSGPAK